MTQIHVEARHLHILQEILKEHPGAYVFGSRVTGKHKPFSDMDICFIRKDPVPLLEISLLREALEESDLPFTVDIVDYHQVAEEFKAVIDREKVGFPYG